jgi:hypothetical protein
LNYILLALVYGSILLYRRKPLTVMIHHPLFIISAAYRYEKNQGFLLLSYL